MTTNDDTTQATPNNVQTDHTWLHTTPKQARKLYKKEELGDKLTAEEKAICNLNYGLETARDLVSLICYAGLDVTFAPEQKRLWKSGHRLSAAETIGLQAAGYGFILTAIAETPGMLDAAIVRLRKDLHPLLDKETLFAVLDSLLAEDLEKYNASR